MITRGIGVKFNRLLASGDGGVDLAGLLEDGREGEPVARHAGGELDRLAKVGDGLLVLLHLPMAHSQVVKSGCEIRLKRNGPAISRQREIETPLVAKKVAEIALGEGVVGGEGDAATDKLKCGVVIAGEFGDDAEQMQGGGVVGIVGEELATDGFGFVEAAGLLVLPGEVDGGEEIHVGGL